MNILMTHTYEISGMTCGSCVAKVKTALLKLGAVTAADVRREAPQATITMQHHIPVGHLQAALSAAGPYAIRETGNQTAIAEGAGPSTGESPVSYYPIGLIFGYVAGAAALVQWGQPAFSGWRWMTHFMAGFYLVFSFFKLLHLRGFAEGYRSYDVVARSLPAWGFVYPFVELALGIAYLTGFRPLLTNAVTLVVMGVSTVGVLQSLLRKRRFQCACLGTIIQLPLSTVTLAEDLLMVAMSAAMLAVLL